MPRRLLTDGRYITALESAVKDIEYNHSVEIAF